MIKPLTIYLAGKIGYMDWRHGLVDGLEGQYHYTNQEWDVMPKAIFDVHHFSGPFPAELGHGQSHGANRHGVGIGSWMNDRPDGQPWLAGQCLRAIDRSDLVFAWVETESAYGTLCEIGYALAKGKHVVVSHARELEGHWFSTAMPGVHSLGIYQSASYALKAAIRLVGEIDTSPQLSARGNKFVYLLQCNDVFKIGVTLSISDRVKQLQTANPHPIQVRHYVESSNYLGLESQLHTRFAPVRQTGEWFTLTEPMVREAIQMMQSGHQKSRSLRDRVRGAAREAA